MSTRRGGRAVDLAWYTFTALYCAFVLGWLLLGLAAALTGHVHAVHAWASAAAAGGHGPGWRRVGAGLLHGAGASYPLVDIILDYAFSVVSLLFAAILFRLARRDWTVRFLIIGVLGSAGAFNLQAHTSIDAMSTMTGVGIDIWHVILLHGVGGVAYVFALLLFPTGTLDWGGGRSWPVRALLVTSVAGAAALISVSAAETPHTISFVLFFGLLTPVAGVTAQLVRYRRATSAEARQQSRVLLYALGLSVAAAVVLAAASVALPTPAMPASGLGLGSDFSIFSGLGPQTAVIFWVFRGVFAMIPFAIMAGVLRFRLWDVEGLFSQTLTYGVLIAMISVVYVAGVVVLGLQPHLVSTLPIVASGLIAIAFQPVRQRVGRWADQLMYGRRPPVYDVLAQVPALIQASVPGPEALSSLARAVAEGLPVTSARVVLDLPDGTSETYRWPAADPGPQAPEHRIPVSYGGEIVGALCLPSAEERRLPPDRQALLSDLSSSMGVPLHNASMYVQLQHGLREAAARSAEIRASRERIVAAQDSERRELERDLHDGAQPSLTAVRVTLGLASHLGQAGDHAAARQALAKVREQITDALGRLADTVRGLVPQIASVRGLVAALRDQAEVLGAHPEFLVTAGPPAGEDLAIDPVAGAAVYFCCTEALQNTVKHCPDAPVRVLLDADVSTGRLRFSVADSGPGFDPAAVPDGGGLQNMADRIGAVGGEVAVRPEPGKGTEVAGWIPIAPALA